MSPTKLDLLVISGGQTGVDRAALDAALEAGAKVGGWCPYGRIAEDGRIPDRYPLLETESSDPAERTRLNVRDADVTLIVAPGEPRGGTGLAAATARQMGRPLLVLHADDQRAIDRVVEWLDAAGAATLNVAGPRASEWPAGYAVAYALLSGALRRLAAREGRRSPGGPS